jgi:hypothetical protein
LYGQGFSIEAQFISPTVGGLSSASLSGTAAGVSTFTYNSIFPTNISSSGYGAVVGITDNGDGTYSFNYAELTGTNYQVNDTLLIVGSKVGGIDGVNDIILTVDSIEGLYGQSGVFFTKPGILSPNISITQNNLVNLPKQTSRIQIEDNGQKIVLLDLTNDDYNNYQKDSLLVKTVFEIGDSYGLIMNRRDTLRNVEAPLDFRGRKYRRFITDLSSYNPALGVGYYGQGDNYYALSTTGEYADFKVFENDSLQYNSEYTIGELIISDSFDRQKFKVKALEDVKFKFTIIAGTTNISKHNDYEVVFKKLFLEGKFLVIRLYNLESKKYKKRLKKKSLKYDCNIYSNGVFKLNL